ncbi:Uncharacterised protein [Mycobacteroides abscessus subsp. massiliense]|nr:Uncharacterised protein [Mycobacteroides abscessus subsp. massiliense]
MSSSKVAHSGCSSVGGKMFSQVSSPLMANSVTVCWNRMKFCTVWLAAVMG